MKNLLKKAFPMTIPVLLGYVPLGIAFGLMMQNAGYNVIWAAISSIAIFSGTGQFVEVGFLEHQTAIIEIIVVIVVLNTRMMFYGLSFLERYRVMGKKKWLLMFGLTDETYALLCVNKTPEGVKETDFLMAVTFLDQSYWVLGTIIGVVAGSLISFDMTGIDFIMTTLFVVLAIDQWKAYPSHEPFFIGLVSAVVSLLIFGPDNFLIPAFVVIITMLLLRRKQIEAKSLEVEGRINE